MLDSAYTGHMSNLDPADCALRISSCFITVQVFDLAVQVLLVMSWHLSI